MNAESQTCLVNSDGIALIADAYVVHESINS
jgi:hypothetical protein